MLLGEKKPISKLIYYLILLFIPFFTLFILETIHRGSPTAFTSWVLSSPVSVLVTYLFLLFITGILFLLPRRVFLLTMLIQLFIWALIAFISYKKYQLRGDYLSPYDFYLLKEAAGITENMDGLISVKWMIAGIVFVVVSVLFYILINRISITVTLKKRLIIAIVGVLGLVLFFYKPTILSSGASEEGTLQTKYEKLGFIGGFLTILNQNRLAEELDTESIRNVLHSDKYKVDNYEVDPDFKPNVIVVLAEALWDPLLLTNIKFEEDPIPYTRSLMENYTSGELVTHIFGGGTINSELETLTGLSTRFLPEGAETYNHYINRPIDSLAHNFRNQGYHTTAVHTFKNWFYDRNKTYEYLGFEKYVSMEFFNNPEMVGPYIDDRELMRQSLSEISKTDGPDFLNVATVASHGPYDDIRYEEKLEFTTEGNLTDVPEYILNLYLKVLNELDDSIKLLIDGINELDEPTMVVIYGDHLPMLGADYAVYREAEYYSDLNLYEDHKKMYTTPLIVWDNFSDPEEKENLRMTPNFLGSYILEKAKKEKSPIFKVSGHVYDSGLTVIPPKQFWGDEGVNETELVDYQILQQDILFGKQKSYAEYPVEVAPNYFLGSEKMKIKDISIGKNNKGKPAYILKGKGFVSNVKVYVNGKAQKSVFKSSSEIICDIPKDLIGKDKEVTIEVKLIDDEDHVIAESEYTKKK
ncbi:sulfatase-like hydrolase/transferase [Bacillus sp. JJ1566]|uniref:sulfatase-like hydrolase/transferase n=1 Tax=Bacillus sp. JJ1566 TaxID=3122961 RepID=UPI002FFD5F86